MERLVKVSLTGVPETMLYTLYNRAQEAKRSSSIISDPEAIRIYDSIDFDFTRFFGSVLSGAIAARAATFDKILNEWLKDHPNTHVISLGEGLETQRQRVDNGSIRWLSVDLPEVINLREQFLPSTNRFQNLAESAFDLSWLDKVDASGDVFIIAQGLFMYFEEHQVKKLITAIFKRLPRARLVFDFVAIAFIQKTQNGFKLSDTYKLPPMYWGVGHKQVKNVLRNWINTDISVKTEYYDIFTHGFQHYFLDRFLRHIPSIGNQLPGIAYVYAN